VAHAPVWAEAVVANIATAKLALIAKKFVLDLFSLADFMICPPSLRALDAAIRARKRLEG